jgi:hypothetical protein
MDEETRQVYLLDNWYSMFATAEVPLAQWGIRAISWNGRVYLLDRMANDGIPIDCPLDPLPVEAKPWRENSPPPEVPLG